MKANSFHLGNLATVYDCEMEGIRRAAQKLLTLDVSGQEITIYCDNQSCVKTISLNYTTSRLAALTHLTLQRVGQSNDLTIEWIPGHRGYYGNEMADKFAKRGCTIPYESPEPILPLRESVINMEIRKWTESMWQERWRCSKAYRQTKLWIKNPKIGNHSIAQSIDRHKLSMLTGIITGHSRMKRHLFHIGVSPNPMCDCGSEESPAHVVSDCPIHVMNRLLHLKKSIIHESELKDLDYSSVLSFFMATGVIAGSNNKVPDGTV